MTAKEKMKMNWMKAYEATLYSLNHAHGQIDWDTANYLFLKGENPIQAAKNMMDKASPSVPMVCGILKSDQEKDISSQDFKNL